MDKFKRNAILDLFDLQCLRGCNCKVSFFLFCVCAWVAGLSKEAANVSVRPSDLHTGQRIHLRQFKVLRVTTSQVSI